MIILIVLSISFLFSISLTSEQIDKMNQYRDSGYLSEDYSNLFNSIIQQKIESENLDLYILLYEACIFNDELTLANQFLNSAISLDKKNQDLRDLSFKLDEYRNQIDRARKTLEKGLIEEAIRDYENIITAYPKRALPYYERGVAYRSSKDYKNAILSFNKARKINPNNEIYVDAIISIAQRIASEADEDRDRQDYNSAIPKYLEAIEFYPEFTQALFNLAYTFFKLKDYENAEKYLLQNISINENHIQTLDMLGNIYKNKDPKKSISYYEKAIEIDSNYHRAYYALGTLYFSVDINKSELYLKSAIDIKSDYSKAYETLGILYMQLEKHDQAFDNLTISSNLDSKSDKSNYLLSEICNIKGDFSIAKEYAKKAILINRKCAPAYFHLGVAEKNLENRPAAKDAFEKAKKSRVWRDSAAYELELLEKGK